MQFPHISQAIFNVATKGMRTAHTNSNQMQAGAIKSEFGKLSLAQV
jgi:hypothetical protein